MVAIPMTATSLTTVPKAHTSSHESSFDEIDSKGEGTCSSFNIARPEVEDTKAEQAELRDTVQNPGTLPVKYAPAERVRMFLTRCLLENGFDHSSAKDTASRWVVGTGNDLRGCLPLTYRLTFGTYPGWPLYREVQRQLWREQHVSCSAREALTVSILLLAPCLAIHFCYPRKWSLKFFAWSVWMIVTFLLLYSYVKGRMFGSLALQRYAQGMEDFEKAELERNGFRP